LGLGVGDFHGGQAEALDRGEDVICRLGPAEGFWVVVDDAPQPSAQSQPQASPLIMPPKQVNMI
jgi:hypothetical protein